MVNGLAVQAIFDAQANFLLVLEDGSAATREVHGRMEIQYRLGIAIKKLQKRISYIPSFSEMSAKETDTRDYARKQFAVYMDVALHTEAAEHARREHRTNFSGLVTKLLVDEFNRHRAANRSNTELPQLPTLADYLAAKETLAKIHGLPPATDPAANPRRKLKR